MAKYSMVLSRGVTIADGIACCSRLKILPFDRVCVTEKRTYAVFFVPKDVFTIDHNVSVCLEGFNRNLCEEYNGPNLSKSAGSTPV